METTRMTARAKRHAPRLWGRWQWTQDPERMAIYLLIGFIAVWLVTMLSVQAVLIVQHHGTGLGIGGGQHVPASIVRQIGVGDNLEKMMQATNRP